jgi:signal transduction histidine kinase
MADNAPGLKVELHFPVPQLRISQIEARDRTAAFRKTDLSAIVREVVELFEPAAEERAVRLQLSAGEAVFVVGDRDLLFDAISNLVDNAIKHGGDQGDVGIVVAQGVGGPVLSISDRGPGIPNEECKHVLRRFYRLEGSRSSPGNGLGLSLVAAASMPDHLESHEGIGVHDTNR